MDPVPNQTVPQASPVGSNPADPAAPPAAPPAQPLQPSQPSQPQSFTLKVGGQDRQVTQAELIEMATKSAGADAKFEEAARVRKEAQKGLRVMEILGGLKEEQDLNPAVVYELYGLLGMDPSQAAQLFEGGTMTPPKQTTPAPAANLPGSLIKPEQLSPEIRASLDYAEKMELQNVRENMRKSTREAVDKDEVLGKIMKELDGKDREQIRNELYEMAIEEVDRSVLMGQPFGADSTRAAVQKLRARISRIGIPTGGTGLPLTQPGQPGGGGNMFVVPNEPVQRVPAKEATYADNFATRVMQSLRSVGRG
jgi:DNA-binding protein Fis